MVNSFLLEVTKKKDPINLFVSTLFFLIYTCLLFFAISKHELWGDEIHSWNIAKASKTLGDLMVNIRYEGHPPAWYFILYVISLFTHNPECMQWVHAFISVSIIFLIVYYSPFPLLIKIVIPFGYYFAYEYSVLSRNYALGILIAVIICILIKRTFRFKTPILFLLLFLLSNTHLLGALLAFSFCVCFAFEEFETNQKIYPALFKILIGLLVISPALYFVIPPSDSEMNFSFWMDRWNLNQLIIIFQIPVKSFLTIPAWWEYHFWNTNFLLQSTFPGKNIFIIVITFTLLGLLFYVLRNSKKAIVFFYGNFLLTCCMAFVFPLTSTRYVGFVFISFVVAIWLCANEFQFTKTQKALVVFLLGLQLTGASLALSRDLILPFSNSEKVSNLYKEIPANELIVTDYWCLNNLSAFVDKPFYCLELNKELTFLLWDQHMAKAMKGTNKYTTGLQKLFAEKSIKSIYMITVMNINDLQNRDALLTQKYNVTQEGQYEGAIERNSNVYLYRINNRE